MSNRLSNPLGMMTRRTDNIMGDYGVTQGFMQSYGMACQMPQRMPVMPPMQQPMMPGKVVNYGHSDSSESEELTVEDIIDDKPGTKLVREFFRGKMLEIRSEEEKMFG